RRSLEGGDEGHERMASRADEVDQEERRRVAGRANHTGGIGTRFLRHVQSRSQIDLSRILPSRYSPPSHHDARSVSCVRRWEVMRPTISWRDCGALVPSVLVLLALALPGTIRAQRPTVDPVERLRFVLRSTAPDGPTRDRWIKECFNELRDLS